MNDEDCARFELLTEFAAELARQLVESRAEVRRLEAAIREHDRRSTHEGGGRASCSPVLGEVTS